ncbi:hypothetical protein XFF6990_390030 [Xanthomonas citri pv. fuscans]|nr:hypothetical protein XFF6990_390030 [Xanthomonas citri pv. fuscans]
MNSRASANTTPPLAVPSSLVTTRPVTPTAAWNWRSCEMAFWPVVPSMTIKTSCGAAASILPSTRRILPSSFISPVWVCRRPAVSAISTSVPRALAACSASNATDAASAFCPCAITATPLRSPQACNCATAAARKVSPAASIRLLPSSLKRLASLPMVVVLPTPLTPTVSTTNGLSERSITSGLETGCSRAMRSARKALNIAWASTNSRDFIRLRRPSISAVVAPMPTSAVINAVSISSSRSSSSLGLRENRPPKLRAKALLRSRSRQPGFPADAAGRASRWPTMLSSCGLDSGALTTAGAVTVGAALMGGATAGAAAAGAGVEAGGAATGGATTAGAALCDGDTGCAGTAGGGVGTGCGCATTGGGTTTGALGALAGMGSGSACNAVGAGVAGAAGALGTAAILCAWPVRAAISCASWSAGAAAVCGGVGAAGAAGSPSAGAGVTGATTGVAAASRSGSAFGIASTGDAGGAADGAVGNAAASSSRL